jgi:Holliday junction resolvasome RuvABC endonuclease subunit
MVLYVGADLSLCSPAFAAVVKGTLHGRYWPQTRVQKHQAGPSAEIQPVACVSLLPLLRDDCDRYALIAAGLVAFCACLRDGTGGQRVVVVIENYAFGAHGAHSHKLAELGGVCKHELTRAGFSYKTIPPSSVKKAWTGSGSASKERMYTTFEARYGPAVFTHLARTAHKAGARIPNPIQDLVDATALALTAAKNPNANAKREEYYESSC